MYRIPLAWLQLKREKLRLLVAVAGVAFAVVLIFMQLGFRNALFESSVRVHDALDADLVIISTQFDFLAQPKTFSRRRLYQALGAPGVASVAPLYASVGLWKNPYDGSSRNIFILGIDPSAPAVDLPDVRSQLALIRLPDMALFDSAARPEYGPVADQVRAGKPLTLEVSNRRITIGGLFQLGTSFGIDGTIVTSDLNFLRMFSNRDPGLIEVGLIRLAPNADVKRVQEFLRTQFPGDVRVLTKAEFMEREKQYWAVATPIGFVFNFGVIMGFVVGAIIVYQILFADVTDHLAEYATLKAMGYPNRFLFSIVLQEAMILAVLGYLPGLALCAWLYRQTENATRLPMTLDLKLGLFVIAIAVVMCSVSGVVAVRKIRSADPAEIF
jgi:putative ABC transport system permease protein